MSRDLPAGAQIRATVPCAMCESTGTVKDPWWKALGDWARDHEYDSSDPQYREVFMRRQGLDAIPPERTLCPACSGAGELEARITVEDLVLAVVAEFDRPPVSVATVRGWVADVERAITAAASASAGLVGGDVDDHLRTVQEGANALLSLEPLARPRPTTHTPDLTDEVGPR